MNHFNATKNVTSLNTLKVIPEGGKRERERETRTKEKRKSMMCSPS